MYWKASMPRRRRVERGHSDHLLAKTGIGGVRGLQRPRTIRICGRTQLADAFVSGGRIWKVGFWVSVNAKYIPCGIMINNLTVRLNFVTMVGGVRGRGERCVGVDGLPHKKLYLLFNGTICDCAIWIRCFHQDRSVGRWVVKIEAGKVLKIIGRNFDIPRSEKVRRARFRYGRDIRIGRHVGCIRQKVSLVLPNVRDLLFIFSIFLF